MRWKDLRGSSNIEDRRGISGRGIALGGGGLGVIVIALAVLLCGGDPSSLFQGGGIPDGQQVQAPANAAAPAKPDENQQFASAIMGSLEDAWKQILPTQARVRYQDPKLVLYTGQTRSACGLGDAAMGPFYCPGDMKLYLDFAFFNELRREFKAPGDFAQAYVIAHEFGHHIQNLMGTMERLQASGAGNRGSVALELQADCYAGIWANYAAAQGRLEAGDTEEALRAASAVGDDMIQKRTQGYVVPDSFTHGSSSQRVEWFSRGFKTGNMANCRTFR
ncbi:MAG: zinc metallopeptidase [Acidobacteria bacterium]|nr:zinc metallopeptidase [Acidobacteriota bacterium]